jgi:UDP-2,3-diacylglucosamine pyrophosphatase LpxH
MGAALKKIIVMSDCHRGDGSAADDFARNSLLYKCALEHYHEQGYTYIELGDGEDLWEIKNFEQIYITHTSIYDLLRKFHDPDPRKTRYIKVWGNHDEYWQDHAEVLQGLFPGIRVYGAVALGNILMIHGHQADTTCSGPAAKVSKFLVRHVWGGLQKFGIGDPTRAAENPGLCNRIDTILQAWATGREIETDEEQKGTTPSFQREMKSVPIFSIPPEARIPTPPFILIAGHTHRPVFANLSQTERRFLECGVGLAETKATVPEPVYYNTGSCVHPRCITGLEIEYDGGALAFTLVKWSQQANAEICTTDGCRTWPLAIARTVLQT